MKRVLAFTGIFLVLGVLIANDAPSQTFQDRARLFKEGNTLLRRGLARQAILRFEQALQIARTLRIRKGEGAALGSLGIAYEILGDSRRAISYHEQALKIFREIGDRKGEEAGLANLGIAYNALGDYRRAISYHQQALKIAREIGNRRGVGADLGNLGSAYRNLGDYRRAISYHEQALKIAREIGNRRGEGNNLGNLGNAYYSLSDYRRAISYNEQALKIAREIGDRRAEGIRLGNLGAAYDPLGDYRRAISYYEQALKIAREIGNRRGEGNRLGNLGIAYNSLGDYRRAIFYHEQALKISREVGDRRGEQQRLGNLGVAYSDLGDYRRAIFYHEQALKIAREIGDRSGKGSYLGNLGLAYRNLGDYRRAISYHEQALKIAREIGDRSGEGSGLSGLGNAYHLLGDFRRAISYHDQALKIAREIHNRRGEGLTLGNLGIAYQNLGDYRRAISYFEEALAIFEKIGARRKVGITRGNLGIAHLLAGDVDKAGTYLEEAHPLRKAIYRVAQGRPRQAASLLEAILAAEEERGDPEILFGTYITLARAYEVLKEVKKARAFYRKAVGVVERGREGLTEKQREFFFGAKPYFTYTRLTPYEGLIRLSKAEDGFEFAEAMKARRLLEQAASRESGRDPAVSDALRTEEDEGTRELFALLKRKDSATKRNDTKDLDEIEAALKVTRSKRTALIARLYKEAPEYAAIRYPRPLKVEEVNLKPGEVLIEFALTDTTAHAFLLRGNRIVKGIRKDMGRAEVEKLVEDYRRQISEVARLSEPNFDHTAGYRLYSLLLKDLLPLVRKDEEIILVPDGKLALLPFQALPITPEKPVMKQGPYGYFPSGVAWLGDVYRIRYEQSASALTQRRSLGKRSGRGRRPAPTKGLFALADPVFGKDDPRYGRTVVASAKPKGFSLMKAVEEQGGLQLVRLEETGRLANRLGRLFPSQGSELLTGLNATKRNIFAKDLRQYRYLVFATHGLLGGKVSGLMEPALVLSRGDGKERDAFLTLSEAMTLRLNADVVALTACDTGVGKQVAGEGVMGMGRAFQYAGAKSVLVSLWSVAEASTTLLVERFFSHLKNGADKVSALRQAREDVLRAGYRHPFFWSPFILIGGGDAPRAEAAPVQRTPERVARAETAKPESGGLRSSREIVSYFVRVKTMGIGGTREGRLTFRNILFDFNSAELKRESIAQLEEMGNALALLAQERRMRFRIEGHTDAKGSDTYNQSLSQRRAGAVVRHLIEKHRVPRSNLQAIGQGESRPVASNQTIAGRALNRRVELVLVE